MKNIFSKLFQKSDSQKSLNTKALNIDTSQTPEKFQHLATEIIEFLVSNLQILDKIENEIFKKYQVLQAQMNYSNQTHPDEETLWTEYAQRCEEIINPISLNNYKGTHRSFEKPTKYEYLGYPDTKIIFIMKSENRAVIEMEFEIGIRKKDQFVLKKNENGWKIDTKKYGFPGENTWWKDEI